MHDASCGLFPKPRFASVFLRVVYDYRTGVYECQMAYLEEDRRGQSRVFGSGRGEGHTPLAEWLLLPILLDGDILFIRLQRCIERRLV